MGVPSFADLGNYARDVLRNGYHYGRSLFKFNVKTRSGDSFDVVTDMTLNFEAHKFLGNMSSKVQLTDYGLVSCKWNTDGTIFVGYDAGELLNAIEGLGIAVEGGMNRETSARSGKLTTRYCNSRINTDFTVQKDLDSTTSVLGSAVVAFKNFYIGHRLGYNISLSKLTKNDMALAFNYDDIGVHLRCTSIPDEYGLSLYYRVNSTWETGMDGIYARRDEREEWVLGIGAKKKLDYYTTLRFKVNTDLQMGTSLKHRLLKGIDLTLSFNVDCTNPTRGAHRVGFALDMEA